MFIFHFGQQGKLNTACVLHEFSCLAYGNRKQLGYSQHETKLLAFVSKRIPILESL